MGFPSSIMTSALILTHTSVARYAGKENMPLFGSGWVLYLLLRLRSPMDMFEGMCSCEGFVCIPQEAATTRRIAKRWHAPDILSARLGVDGQSPDNRRSQNGRVYFVLSRLAQSFSLYS